MRDTTVLRGGWNSQICRLALDDGSGPAGPAREARGGRRLAENPDHLYWRLLDALGYAPDATKLAGPWRVLGRADLTPQVLGRLEAYVAGLLDQYP
ncbi:hypothetical protein [Streptomyces bluensis]|uniref:hypothetical protein n=1 Tax=Streptomyces bluensis TaxID=33897 RepID=UPI003EB97A43